LIPCFLHLLLFPEHPADCKLPQIPIGTWPKNPQLKELGRFELVHMHMSVDSHTPALFTRVLNYTPEQAHALMEGVKREFRDKDLRLITSYRFLTGRRPGGSGSGSQMAF
jgi:hypothetical protein